MTGRIMWLFLLLLGSHAAVFAQQRIPFAGYWLRWIGDTLYDNVSVPSSYRPIGTARLVRMVDFPALTANQRMMLRFKGIGGSGTLLVNGHEAGSMGAYARYDFDITQYVKAGANRIELDITDWQAPTGLGPTAAWEAHGGIIYDVYAEIRSDPYIGNARLSYKPSDDEQQDVPLRWGLEVASSNILAVATRTNPVTVFTTPAIGYTKQAVHEEYRALLYSIPVKRKPISRILVTMKALPSSRPVISRPNATGSGYSAGDTALLLFAVTAERK